MLIQSYNEVRTSFDFTNTHLMESFYREYQAPVGMSGCHPTMTTSGSGGYYYTAITVKRENTAINKISAQDKKRIKLGLTQILVDNGETPNN